MKKLFCILLSICFLFSLTACNESTSSSPADEEKTYSVGKTATVKATYGMYSLTVTGVEEIQERNQFSDSQPKRVVLIHYAYENIDCTQDITISYLYFHVYDAEGNQLEVYPATVESPNTVSAGGKKTASVAYGLDSSTNSLKLQFYNVDYSDMSHPECTFNLGW